MRKYSEGSRVNTGFPGFAFALFLLIPVSCSKSIPVHGIEAQPVTHVIEIKKFQFRPPTLVVRSGDIVRWENKDIVPHQISEVTLKKWSSRDLSPGDSFTLQVEDTTSYICKLHPAMHGKIIVQDRK